jgi:D-amino-acid dehydrogenase
MTYDVAIIGAGVVAVQSALQLVEKGLRVAVIDSAQPGGEQAASYGNAGWLSSHSVLPPSSPGVWKQIPKWLLDPLGPLTARFPYALKAAPWLYQYLRAGDSTDKLVRTAQVLRTLLVDAPALHAQVAAQVGAEDLIDAHSGLVHAFLDRSHYARATFGWDLRRQLGIEVVELDAQALRSKEPHLSPQYTFGLFVPEAGHCKNPGAYVQRIVSHLLQRQVTFIQARALELQVRNGKLLAVRTSNGDIACGQAVVAAGIWSKQLARTLGDRMPLESERGYHAMVKGADLQGPAIPLMLEDRKVVINQMHDGVRCAGQVEIAGVDAKPNWQRAEILRRHLVESFPALVRGGDKNAHADVWLGHRPSTYDGIPVIGRSPRCAQVVYACGHGHVGLVGSARTGRLVAQMMAGESTEIDVAPFSPKRFG